jgi:toxin ParE1/3/4
MGEYRLSPAAQHDLELIWLHTNQQWGTKQANQYVDQLTEAFAALARIPEASRPCDHIRKDYRRRRVDRHIVYFRTTDYGIAVIRILHERMESAQHL